MDIFTYVVLGVNVLMFIVNIFCSMFAKQKPTAVKSFLDKVLEQLPVLGKAIQGITELTKNNKNDDKTLINEVKNNEEK